MVKAIIFDLWETLGTKNVGISKSLQDKFGIEKNADFMHLYENSVQLKEWETEEEMAKSFLKEFQIEQNNENIKYVVNLFREGIEKATMFSGMKDLLLKLKKNYKLGFISNTTVFESVVLDKWGIRDVFDVVSFSWELGIKKPAKEIFNITLQKLEVNPYEAIFIDDGEKNISKAKEYGLNGIVFKTAGQLQDELKKMHLL
ncbi:HAD-IA family hydrolase [Patescibacteria group bacterium]|nr:HAD-IA family hydrolase [Patescibacteria group bacterium]MBU1727996.1 HAD-IA family hydrolase [Patescibacteria group bacterium]